MENVQPYSIKLFLAKLLANKGAVLSLLVSVAVAFGFISEQQGQDYIPIIIAVVTAISGWLAGAEAKKDVEGYKEYAERVLKTNEMR